MLCSVHGCDHAVGCLALLGTQSPGPILSPVLTQGPLSIPHLTQLAHISVSP